MVLDDKFLPMALYYGIVPLQNGVGPATLNILWLATQIIISVESQRPLKADKLLGVGGLRFLAGN